jgi:hypothetical protein
MLIAPTAPALPRLLITEAGVKAWLVDARPGAALLYHRGFLLLDRQVFGSQLSVRDRTELNRVADVAMALAEAGRLRLVQRRHGDADYSYLAVASSGRSRGDRS